MGVAGALVSGARGRASLSDGANPACWTHPASAAPPLQTRFPHPPWVCKLSLPILDLASIWPHRECLSNRRRSLGSQSPRLRLHPVGGLPELGCRSEGRSDDPYLDRAGQRLLELSDWRGIPTMARGRGAPLDLRLAVAACLLMPHASRASRGRLTVTVRELRDFLFPNGWERRRDWPRTLGRALPGQQLRDTRAVPLGR